MPCPHANAQPRAVAHSLQRCRLVVSCPPRLKLGQPPMGCMKSKSLANLVRTKNSSPELKLSHVEWLAVGLASHLQQLQGEGMECTC